MYPYIWYSLYYPVRPEWEQKTLEQEDDFCTQVITLNSFQWTWDTVFVQYIQTHLILWLNQ